MASSEPAEPEVERVDVYVAGPFHGHRLNRLIMGVVVAMFMTMVVAVVVVVAVMMAVVVMMVVAIMAGFDTLLEARVVGLQI